MPNLKAQIAKKELLDKLETALSTYLVNVYPHHFCPDNKSRHTYMGQLGIDKMGVASKPIGPNKFEDRYMVWGHAHADYHNGFLSGSSQVNYLAQLKKEGEEWVIVKLKWKKNDCMQYKTLLDLEADEPAWWEVAARNQEPETLDWAQEADMLPDSLSLLGEELNAEAEIDPQQSLERAYPLEYLRVIPTTPLSAEPGSTEVAASASTPIPIAGVIMNNADHTTYKDAVLEIRFYSKTHTLLDRAQWTLYEFFYPQQEMAFEYPAILPEHTHRFEVRLLKAIPIE
ncbi:MAG: hypothetical protein D6730_05455 [Bacteroidetes bacterium]|nr:MAG: hypothetical protein D6730_05455 [Bacteroidota bacterium]